MQWFLSPEGGVVLVMRLEVAASDAVGVDFSCADLLMA